MVLKTFFDKIGGLFNEENEISGPKVITPTEEPKPLVSTWSTPALTGEVHRATNVPRKTTDMVSVQGTSMAKFMDEVFNPYKYSKFITLYTMDEPSFYRDYEDSYKQNPFTSMVIEYLMNEIFANDYHFEGPGANVVENFFFEDNTRMKLKMVWRETLVKGNGFMDLSVKGKKLTRTRVIPTDSIVCQIDATIGSPKYGERTYFQSSKKLNDDLFIHFMVREQEGYPYSISLLRNNYIFLTALYDCGGDIISAIKRTAYAPIVTRLDLEGYTEEEKPTIIANYKTVMEEFSSASTNFVIDKRHEMDLLGSGGVGARLLPTNDMISPIISVVLMNFGIPLGMFLQTGANKAIIDEQRRAMQRFYDDMRTKIKYYVERKIIPHITGRDTKLIFNNPPIIDEATQKAMLTHMSMFKEGILSREYILDFWDIDDKGEIVPPISDQVRWTDRDMNKTINKKGKEAQYPGGDPLNEAPGGAPNEP